MFIQRRMYSKPMQVHVNTGWRLGKLLGELPPCTMIDRLIVFAVALVKFALICSYVNGMKLLI